MFMRPNSRYHPINVLFFIMLEIQTKVTKNLDAILRYLRPRVRCPLWAALGQPFSGCPAVTRQS